jgi:hypothetical protein
MRTEHEQAMESFAKASTWIEKTGGYAHSMTLRDHYAGLAMQSLIVVYTDDKHIVGEYSERAYQIADAMLKERVK